MKLLLTIISMFLLIQGVFAVPCSLVTDPQQMQFIPLNDVAKYLEEDMDLGKGITGIIGKKIIEKRFRNAGIPDPVKSNLSYCMVGRESGLDSLNFCFIFKGDVDEEKFVSFAKERYEEYQNNLRKDKLLKEYKDSVEKEVSGKWAVSFPFVERNSETLILSLGEYLIIGTVPSGNYSLIEDVIQVLEGKKPIISQDNKISYKTVFIPNENERKEIVHLENRYEKLRDKARSKMSKIMNKMGIQVKEKDMRSLEQNIKKSLSEVEKFMYKVEATKENTGYSYQITMNFMCQDEEHAENLKELFLAMLTNNASKNLTRNDMVSYKANKITSKGQYFIYRINIGSSEEEQNQFSAMTLTLLLQDKRFTRIFQK